MNIPPIHGLSCREKKYIYIYCIYICNTTTWCWGLTLKFWSGALRTTFPITFFPAIWVTATMCFGSKSACFWGVPQILWLYMVSLRCSDTAERNHQDSTWAGSSSPAERRLYWTHVSSRASPALALKASSEASPTRVPRDGDLRASPTVNWCVFNISGSSPEGHFFFSGDLRVRLLRSWATVGTLPSCPSWQLLPVPAGFWHPVWARSWVHVS